MFHDIHTFCAIFFTGVYTKIAKQGKQVYIYLYLGTCSNSFFQLIILVWHRTKYTEVGNSDSPIFQVEGLPAMKISVSEWYPCR